MSDISVTESQGEGLMTPLTEAGSEQICRKTVQPSAPMVQIEGLARTLNFVPSRFNARSADPDGTLILYNSFYGAISGFPAALRGDVEQRLRRAGFEGKLEGVTKYLYERGFLVQRGTNEFQRVRMMY